MAQSARLLSDTVRKFSGHLIAALHEVGPSYLFLVFFSGVIFSAYLSVLMIKLQWSALGILVAGLLLVSVCPILWLVSSFFPSYRSGLTLTENLRRNSFPFTAFFLLALFMGEFVFGRPSLSRALLVFILCIGLFFLFRSLIASERVGGIFDRLESVSGYLAAGVVISHGIILTTIVILRHYYFGSVLGEDTGYYNQILWSTLKGEFFKGSLTQARYFSPPVNTEFAVHNSPVLFLILPVYWVFPSFYTLLILRNLALSASAIPLYLMAKEKIGGVAGVLIVVAYFLSANILFQAINAFYPLQFIALFLSFAFFFFFKERFLLFLVFLVLSLSVREEIALTTFFFGFYALFLKRGWRWVIVPSALSLLWWYLSTEWVMVRSQITMEELDRFFEFFGTGHNEVVKTFITQPGKVLEIFFTKENFSYLYELAKPGGMLSLLSVSSIFMIPTVAINSIIGHFMGTMRDISYHYSLLASVCMFHALVHGLVWLSRSGRFFSLEKSRVGTAGALLLVPLMIVGAADVIRYGGGKHQSLTADFQRKPYQETIEKILTIIEPQAAVAAPNILLPQLSYREKLYVSNRLWRYPEVEVDYLILDANVGMLSEEDRNKTKYEKLLSTIREEDKYQLIFKEHGFEVYKVQSLHGSQKGSDR